MDLINIILVAKYFIKYVFKLYRLPNLIINSNNLDLDFYIHSTASIKVI